MFVLPQKNSPTFIEFRDKCNMSAKPIKANYGLKYILYLMCEPNEAI